MLPVLIRMKSGRLVAKPALQDINAVLSEHLNLISFLQVETILSIKVLILLKYVVLMHIAPSIKTLRLLV